MKAKYAYPLIALAALAGYIAGQADRPATEPDVDQRARADRLQKTMWYWMVEYSKSETARRAND